MRGVFYLSTTLMKLVVKLVGVEKLLLVLMRAVTVTSVSVESKVASV